MGGEEIDRERTQLFPKVWLCCEGEEGDVAHGGSLVFSFSFFKGRKDSNLFKCH